jgi:hypothetical protein
VVSGGTLKILGYDSLSLQISNCFLVFDRLFEVSGIISSATTVQTLNTQSLPRYTAGTRVCAYIMATAATTGTFSAATSYTNQDGVSGRTGFFRIGGNNVGNAFQPRFMNLQTGDTGVRSVESIQIQSAITSSAPFNLVLAQPLGMFIDTAQILGPTKTAPNLINGNVVGGFPNVDENACLFYIRLFSTAGSSYNTGNNLGSFIIKEVYEI